MATPSWGNPVKGKIFLSTVGMKPGDFLLTRGFGNKDFPQFGDHDGWDIDNGGAEGDPILAMHAGAVTRALFDGLSGGAGIVRIKAKDSWSSGYAHLRRILVKPGQYVVEGQQIGELGSTGFVTAAHLHFDTTDPDGDRINPGMVLRQFKAAVELPKEIEVNATTEVPAAICDVSSGGTLYRDPNRQSVLLRNWSGAKNVGLYSLPRTSKVGQKAALARIRIDTAGGPAEDLRSAWVGVDKISNVRPARLPR